MLAAALIALTAGSFAADPSVQNSVVLHDDGTWSYDLDVSDIPDLVEGALTWRAVEPLRYVDWDVRDATGETTLYFETADDEVPLPLAERLLGAHRMFDGLLWEVIEIDETLLDPGLVADAERQMVEWVPEELSLEEASQEVYLEGNWEDFDCDNDQVADMHIYDGESRNEKTAPFTSRQERSVRLKWALRPGNCSGVLLRDDWVLTAAHCVIDPATLAQYSLTTSS